MTETVADLYAQLDLFSMADKQRMPAHNGSITSVLALHAALVKAKEDDAWVEGFLRAQRDKRRVS